MRVMSGLPEVASSRARGVVRRRALAERLLAAPKESVVLVSAPAGSGKTTLLRSWIGEAGLAPRTAWISVERDERDPQRFWLAVVEQLRTVLGEGGIVGVQAPSPEFDGDLVARRLTEELAPLDEHLVLVIDDLHELRSLDAQRQLAQLIAHRSPLLQIILLTRHDPSLELHRLRLAGELVEIRAGDLRFGEDETRELLASAGVPLSDAAVETLEQRTEGWAAGLRLAALSLETHPHPEQMIAEFAGTDRTVADYLLAEVLERQPDEVRRLLLRTSILDRVSGPLADRLTGGSGSERSLLSLEAANAFVVAIDNERVWFRYHHLFADLLRLELRRSEPEVIPALHRTAADWYRDEGMVVEALRHANEGRDWISVVRLLADHGFSLSLDGNAAAVDGIVKSLPDSVIADPELAAFLAYREVTERSLDTGAAYIAFAERNAPGVGAKHRHSFDVTLAVTRLAVARQRGDPEAALREVELLLSPDRLAEISDVHLGDDARAVALMHLGIVGLWASRIADAHDHLEQGLEIAGRIARPYLEVGCLAHLALLSARMSLHDGRRIAGKAIELAERQGWAADPIAAVAYATMASADAAQCRVEDGHRWLQRGEALVRPAVDPPVALLAHFVRGELYVAQRRFDDAVRELERAEEIQMALATPHVLTGPSQVAMAQTQLLMGNVAAAHATLGRIAEASRRTGEALTALAGAQLADGDVGGAIEMVSPVIAEAVPIVRAGTIIQAFMVRAAARWRQGDLTDAEADVEQALDLAERDALIFPFVVTPGGELLSRHPRHRTAHASLLTDIIDALSGSARRPPVRDGGLPLEPLTESELRVLRQLPTNLTAPEIAAALFLSTSTVKTHMRHTYEKLGVHRRSEAVERARALGLIGGPHRP